MKGFSFAGHSQKIMVLGALLLGLSGCETLTMTSVPDGVKSSVITGVEPTPIPIPSTEAPPPTAGSTFSGSTLISISSGGGMAGSDTGQVKALITIGEPLSPALLSGDSGSGITAVTGFPAMAGSQ